MKSLFGMFVIGGIVLVTTVSCEDGTRRLYSDKDETAIGGDAESPISDGDGILADSDDILGSDSDGGSSDGAPHLDEGAMITDDGAVVLDDAGIPDEDESPCLPGDTRQIPCGINGNGLQSQICLDGEWQNQGTCVDDDICKNGSTQQVACGINGRGSQAQECVDGQWVDEGTCVDPDECVDYDTRTISCGVNDKGKQAQICIEGHWVNDGDCIVPPQTGRWNCVSKKCVPEYGYAGCGNGTCEPREGESAKSCPADCDKSKTNGKNQPCNDIYDCAFYGWFESTPGYWTCGGIFQKECTVNKSTTYCGKTGYDYCYAGSAGIETPATCAVDCDNKMLNQNNQTGCSSRVDCIFLDWPENEG